MNRKYPNKKKRKGFWKSYERADIKDFRKVWTTSMSFILEENIPFVFSKRGRKPNLTRKELICMVILHVYFDFDFRETEQLIKLLISKQLDHSNCVRWFGKLNPDYINNLVFSIHKKIIGIDDAGDYIADASNATCDRLKVKNTIGEEGFHHVTWKLHTLVQYIFTLGLISVISVWSTTGEKSESPIFRKKLLKKGKVKQGKKCHADKGFFGKKNLKACEKLGLKPNLVPKEIEYSDTYLKKYVKNDYDNESRKKTRGLVEGLFGGFETEMDMKIRCRKPLHRNIYLCLLGVKHNLRTYLRATTLKSNYLFRTNPLRIESFLYINILAKVRIACGA
jgi:hypothetical protein